MEVKEGFTSGPQQGDAYWSLGGLMVVKASGDQTGGTSAVLEGLVPPGGSAPFHIHHNEDEAWYVLEGTITFYVGDQTIHAKPGSFVYGPRGVRHGFVVTGETPARTLVIATPAGFERFTAEVGRPAPQLTLPPMEPPDMEKLARLAAQYNVELLGPLPEAEAI